MLSVYRWGIKCRLDNYVNCHTFPKPQVPRIEKTTFPLKHSASVSWRGRWMTREHVEAFGKRSPSKNSTVTAFSNPIGGISLRPVMKASTSPRVTPMDWGLSAEMETHPMITQVTHLIDVHNMYVYLRTPAKSQTNWGWQLLHFDAS